MCKVWHCREVFESANYVHIEHYLNRKVLHNTIHHSLVINIRTSRYFLLINQSWIILCEFDHYSKVVNWFYMLWKWLALMVHKKMHVLLINSTCCNMLYWKKTLSSGIPTKVAFVILNFVFFSVCKCIHRWQCQCVVN